MRRSRDIADERMVGRLPAIGRSTPDKRWDRCLIDLIDLDQESERVTTRYQSERVSVPPATLNAQTNVDLEFSFFV